MTMTVNPVAVLPSGKKFHLPGDTIESFVSLTFGASDTYVTGGIPLNISHFGFNTKIIYVEPSISNVGGYTFVWVPSTQNMMVFSASGTQLASASAALQNDTVVLQAYGF